MSWSFASLLRREKSGGSGASRLLLCAIGTDGRQYSVREQLTDTATLLANPLPIVLALSNIGGMTQSVINV